MLFCGHFITKEISDPHSDAHVVVKTKLATHTWPNISTMVEETLIAESSS